MADSIDLVIRGGKVVDGSGGDPVIADVAIKDGIIVEVGEVAAQGTSEIDASGKLVTPGFVDIHTHYDGQVTWDERLHPSSWHGVTTCVMGNCGVGFAPVHPEHHDMLIRLMEGVEDIPGAALHEGLKWNWESFPEYLDAIEEIPHDMDICAQVPHGALRVYVMGQAGADREQASEAQIEEMAELAREAVVAGAFGFTTSRTLNHKTSDGQPTPTLTASREELVGIAKGVGKANGVLEVISDFPDYEEEMETLREMCRVSGSPITISITQLDRAPHRWKDMLRTFEEAEKEGLDMKGQVCGRPIGALVGLQGSLNPLAAHPLYQQFADLPLDQIVAKLKDPDIRRAILDKDMGNKGAGDSNPLLRQANAASDQATENPVHRFADAVGHKIFPQRGGVDYEPKAENSIKARGEAAGVAPAEILYDELIEKDGLGFLYYALFNFAYGNLDHVPELVQHPNTLLGLGDGGAHVAVICDASFTTYMLTHWTRDREGAQLELPWVIKAQTRDNALAMGLNDRGLLKPGYKADVNIIDMDTLNIHLPEMAYDLPADGKRLLQRADGYVATIVSGEVVYENGDATGALPGKLVRGPQAEPARAEAAE